MKWIIFWIVLAGLAKRLDHLTLVQRVPDAKTTLRPTTKCEERIRVFTFCFSPMIFALQYYDFIENCYKEKKLFLLRIPWFQWPIIYDIRSKPRRISSPTGSKGNNFLWYSDLFWGILLSLACINYRSLLFSCRCSSSHLEYGIALAFTSTIIIHFSSISNCCWRVA